MKSIKPGRGPSALGAVGSAFAILFGIFWTVGAYSITRNSPFPGVGTLFPLFGLLFIGIGIAQLVYNLKYTVSKDRFSLLDITEPGQELDPLKRRFGNPQNDTSRLIESRLRTLDELKAKGLLSAAEYETRRAKIIQEI